MANLELVLDGIQHQQKLIAISLYSALQHGTANKAESIGGYEIFSKMEGNWLLLQPYLAADGASTTLQSL